MSYAHWPFSFLIAASACATSVSCLCHSATDRNFQTPRFDLQARTGDCAPCGGVASFDGPQYPVPAFPSTGKGWWASLARLDDTGGSRAGFLARRPSEPIGGPVAA